MTESELQAIEARANAATPGPWESSDDAVEWSEHQESPFTDMGCYIQNIPLDADIVVGGSQDEQGGAIGVLNNRDAVFIAAARTDIPALVADNRKLRDAIRNAVSEIDCEDWSFHRLDIRNLLAEALR